MVIARGSILVFVTDLERVADERTRVSEVEVLCYWMQLAHMLLPDSSRTRALVVGTRNSMCNEDTLRILMDCLTDQLAVKVYNSWIRTRTGEGWAADTPMFVTIENSEELENPLASGLDELEQAVKAAGDVVLALRDKVPIRWLAFVGKLEREHRNSALIYFSREEVREIAIQFPGFADNESDKERDVLEGLRRFASMGRITLFEHTDDEWYAFMDVEKIVKLVGKVTAPEERLRDLEEGRCSSSDARKDLAEGVV